MNPWQRHSKYHNEPLVVNGEKFDSRKEARRYSELLLLQRGNHIQNLERQVKYVLIPSQRDPDTGKVIERECAYIADFRYKDRLGEVVVEDTKGVRTDAYIIKRKLMLHVHGIRIREL